MQQTVYVDVLLCINLFVDYFILLSAKYVFSLQRSRLRLISGALCGALGSLIILLPHMPTILSLLSNLSICTGMTAAAFFPLSFKKAVKLILCVYLLSFGYAGAMLAVWTFIAPGRLLIRNSIVYFDISPLFLAVLTVLFYLLFKFFDRRMKKREQDALFGTLEIFLTGKKVKVFGKIDTGSTLCEPFSGDPVIVVCQRALEPLSELPEEKKRVIPYKTLQGEGLLMAFRPDEIVFTYKKKKVLTNKCFIACFQGELDPGGYDALINPQILSMEEEEIS